MTTKIRIRSAGELPKSKYDGHRFVVNYVLPLPIVHGFIVNDTRISGQALNYPGKIHEDTRYLWKQGSVLGETVRRLTRGLSFDNAEALAGRLNAE